ncbi:MAG: GNAT family N-acetyltransferase [Candidatus Competibacteraceae bacterium]|nr:GNAT family N-acetyltransferase [Candidatus Competibacteraceae bacterium]
MRTVPAVLEIVTSGLRLSAALVPWDTEIFGFPVAQIRELEVTNRLSATEAYQTFQEWLDVNEIRIASGRLPHNQLQESMFLEAQGFRFVEMVLHPKIEGIQYLNIPKDSLIITPVLESDLPIVQDIAERAFGYERYHVDPRLDPNLGNKRYGCWVKNSLHHPNQQLLKIMEGQHIVALFIIESKEDQSAYWHLTAISPQWQGARLWTACLVRHVALSSRERARCGHDDDFGS